MKRISKLMALLLAALLLVGTCTVAFAADEIIIEGYVVDDYGDCGPNLKWYFSSPRNINGKSVPGTMIIKGSGTMTSYSDSKPPQWTRLKESINELRVQDGVLSIGSFAFAECDYLTDVILPDSLRRVEASAFEECDSLHKVIMPSDVTEIGESAFANCFRLEDLNIPGSLRTLGKYAFFKCYSLNGEVVIPGGVNTVPDSAFFQCGSISSLTVKEGVVTIGNSAFSGCGMKSVSLPTSLRYLDACAFANCGSLRSVTIPSQINEIPEECFANCTNLSEVTMYKGVRLIKEGAFSNCPISRVTYYGESTEWEKVIIQDYNDGLKGARYSFLPIAVAEEVDTCDYCGKVHPNTFIGKLTAFFHKVLLFFGKLLTLLKKLATFLGIM